MTYESSFNEKEIWFSSLSSLDKPETNKMKKIIVYKFNS